MGVCRQKKLSAEGAAPLSSPLGDLKKCLRKRKEKKKKHRVIGNFGGNGCLYYIRYFYLDCDDGIMYACLLCPDSSNCIC